MDHAVKATGSRTLARFIDRQRFENDELEALYRRYALKLQRASVSTALALVALLAATLGTLGVVYAQAPTVQNLWYAGGTMLCLAMLAMLHVRPANKCGSRDARLAWAGRGALAAAALLAGAGLVSDAKGKAAAHGAWHVVFAVFLAYGMLPLRGWLAALMGLLLPLAHTLAAVFLLLPTEFPHLAWQQVSLFYIIL
jgi:hypothetical protein